jgi:hypothetical protein
MTANNRRATDRQVGGDHYHKLGVYQPWEVLKAWLTPEEYRGYMKGTIIAYLARERDKGGNADIAKAAHTGEALVEFLDELDRRIEDGNLQDQSRASSAERR